MGKTKIEWTDETWNPVTGCTKVSEGCANCYAERTAARLQAMGQPNYVDGFAVRCHPHMLRHPYRWRRLRDVFVCSMSDLFHPEVPDAFIDRIFNTIADNPQHTYQILTKRPERMLAFSEKYGWHSSAWAGVTVESAHHVGRIKHLVQIPAKVRFLSIEPMLTSIDLSSHLLSERDGCPDLDPQWPDMFGRPRGPTKCILYPGCKCGEQDRLIHWVIVGGESGPKARPMRKEWVRGIRDQCQAAGVPFFLKQLGGVNKKAAGKELDGRTWLEMPPREIPF